MRHIYPGWRGMNSGLAETWARCAPHLPRLERDELLRSRRDLSQMCAISTPVGETIPVGEGWTAQISPRLEPTMRHIYLDWRGMDSGLETWAKCAPHLSWLERDEFRSGQDLGQCAPHLPRLERDGLLRSRRDLSQMCAISTSIGETIPIGEGWIA